MDSSAQTSWQCAKRWQKTWPSAPQLVAWWRTVIQSTTSPSWAVLASSVAKRICFRHTVHCLMVKPQHALKCVAANRHPGQVGYSLSPPQEVRDEGSSLRAGPGKEGEGQAAHAPACAAGEW